MVGIYLMFSGNCGEALGVYEKAFGVKVQGQMQYGDLPADPGFPMDEGDRELVLHSMFEVDGVQVMCADNREGCVMGDNMYVSLTTQDEARMRAAWDALKQGGTVYMELAPSFFAKAHGSLRDRFGINWMFTVLNEEYEK